MLQYWCDVPDVMRVVPQFNADVERDVKINGMLMEDVIQQAIREATVWMQGTVQPLYQISQIEPDDDSDMLPPAIIYCTALKAGMLMLEQQGPENPGANAKVKKDQLQDGLNVWIKQIMNGGLLYRANGSLVPSSPVFQSYNPPTYAQQMEALYA